MTAGKPSEGFPFFDRDSGWCSQSPEPGEVAACAARLGQRAVDPDHAHERRTRMDRPGFSWPLYPPSQKRAIRRSEQTSTRLDRPDRLDPTGIEATTDDDVTVVEVDGRVAMAGHQPHGVAEVGQRP